MKKEISFESSKDANANAELNWTNRDYAKCDWNWISGYEEDVLISSINLNNSHLTTLLKTYHPSFEQCWTTITKDCFVLS